VLFGGAILFVSIIFFGLALKNSNNNENKIISQRSNAPTLNLGGIFVRDVTTGKIVQMREEEVTRQTANNETNDTDTTSDVTIYDYSMHKAVEYQKNDSIISKILDDYIFKNILGINNYVGNINCHLVYDIEKNRSVRLSFNRLEGTINVTDSLRQALVKVNFDPFYDEGLKICKAEYTYNKSVNSDVRNLIVRYSTNGITFPKSGKDVLLKNKIEEYINARSVKPGQYDCVYSELFIDEDRYVVVKNLVLKN
jgi:hypothetical protein